MEQLQAHHGYFQSDGQLVFNDSLVIPPKNKRITIIWEDDSAGDGQKNSEQKLTSEQLGVVRQVHESLEMINKEPVDKDTQASFDAFDKGEFKIKLPNRLDQRFDDNFDCCLLFSK